MDSRIDFDRRSEDPGMNEEQLEEKYLPEADLKIKHWEWPQLNAELFKIPNLKEMCRIFGEVSE